MKKIFDPPPYRYVADMLELVHSCQKVSHSILSCRFLKFDPPLVTDFPKNKGGGQILISYLWNFANVVVPQHMLYVNCQFFGACGGLPCYTLFSQSQKIIREVSEEKLIQRVPPWVTSYFYDTLQYLKKGTTFEINVSETREGSNLRNRHDTYKDV